MPRKKGYTRQNNVCELNRDLVLAMAAQGASLADIKRCIGTGRTRIREFLRRNGVERQFSTSNPKEKHGNWKGGRLVDKDGYALLHYPTHPHRRKHTPYVLEHRLVMEQHLGRFLDPSEVVHHRNKDKQDNRIENLELFSSNGAHLKHELTGHCPKWSPEGFRRIQEREHRRGGPGRPRKLQTEALPDAPQ